MPSRASHAAGSRDRSHVGATVFHEGRATVIHRPSFLRGDGTQSRSLSDCTKLYCGPTPIVHLGLAQPSLRHVRTPSRRGGPRFSWRGEAEHVRATCCPWPRGLGQPKRAWLLLRAAPAHGEDLHSADYQRNLALARAAIVILAPWSSMAHHSTPTIAEE